MSTTFNHNKSKGFQLLKREPEPENQIPKAGSLHPLLHRQASLSSQEYPWPIPALMTQSLRCVNGVKIGIFSGFQKVPLLLPVHMIFNARMVAVAPRRSHGF